MNTKTCTIFLSLNNKISLLSSREIVYTPIFVRKIRFYLDYTCYMNYRNFQTSGSKQKKISNLPSLLGQVCF